MLPLCLNTSFLFFLPEHSGQVHLSSTLALRSQTGCEVSPSDFLTSPAPTYLPQFLSDAVTKYVRHHNVEAIEICFYRQLIQCLVRVCYVDSIFLPHPHSVKGGKHAHYGRGDRGTRKPSDTSLMRVLILFVWM